MKRVLVTAALAILALPGGAWAQAADTPDSFHGVRILSTDAGEKSGDAPVEAVSQTLGPYATDAVVFLTWTGEITYRAPHGLAEPQVSISYDGHVSHAKNAKMTVASDAPTGYRTSDTDRLFLKKGQTTTISLDVGDHGGLAASKPMSVARLQTLAIAAHD